MQHINYVRAAHRLRIVHARVLKAEIFAELIRALVRDEAHVLLAAKFQAAGRTSLDARRFQTLADAIGTERALVNLLRHRIEARNIERAARDAILATNAIFLVKVDNTVGILHDRAVRRARVQAPRIGAMHALVLAHQPLNRPVGILVLVELDQIPEIPVRLRHRLVRVVESRRLERHVVPLDARDLAGLAANAGRGIDELADLQVALHSESRSSPAVSRNLIGLQCLTVCHKGVLSSQLSVLSFHQLILSSTRFHRSSSSTENRELRTENFHYTFSIFTKKPLNSGVYAFGSITVGVNWFVSVFAVLPSSSAMPRNPQ